MNLAADQLGQYGVDPAQLGEVIQQVMPQHAAAVGQPRCIVPRGRIEHHVGGFQRRTRQHDHLREGFAVHLCLPMEVAHSLRASFFVDEDMGNYAASVSKVSLPVACASGSVTAGVEKKAPTSQPEPQLPQ